MPPEPPPLRTLIVDDEAPARALLREFLADEPDVEVVAECTNGFEAVKAMGELEPDLVLLDVQMPKLDGFEALELADSPAAVIFVTAYDEYALRAFEVHAVDYLLKPVGRDRLAEAIERARVRRQAGAGASPAAPSAVTPAAARSAAALAATARPPGRWLERVLIKEGTNVSVIPVERVDWIEAQDDYVAIHVAGKTHLKPQPLVEIAAALDPERFIRIHRSYLLNLERLARLELYAKDSRLAILKDGKELPVSRAGYARLKELL